MNQQFENKVAFVTGATSGIGQACATAFARSGAKLVCVGRKEDALRELEQILRETGSELLTIRANLDREDEAERAVQQAVEVFGGIDVLVNAAGHISSGTIENTSLEAWDDMMNVNVRAAFVLMQKAMPSLIERRGNVVNISSVTGFARVSGRARLLRFESSVGPVNKMCFAGAGVERRARERCQSRRRRHADSQARRYE